ncbi:MAG: hypothetical protein GXY09_08930 [Bacteroidales bacterium]|nr:hypothetical protein [Bacteroidales bacterium]
MTHLSKNLVYFGMGLFALTILFRLLLSHLLQATQFNAVWLLATVYTVAVFSLGWVFGKKDKQFLPLFDIGFRIHATTYVISNAVAECWLLLGLLSDYESPRIIHLTALFWGLGLLLHGLLYLLSRKQAIKGIKRTDLFE